jgi:lipopolysaccharide transport system permease protein
MPTPDTKPDPAAISDPGAPARVPEETVIEPASGWDFLGLRDLWHYRELLFFFAWRDVKVRYKQTVLGAAWALFQPLLLMTVFWLFLGKVAKVPTGELPYALFVFSGLVPWFLFSTSVSAASNSLLESERLISKVYFPRLTVPFAATGPAVIDFCISTVLLVVLMAAHGVAPGATIVLAPIAVVLIVLTALGVGTFLAALNVAYRDFRYVVPFLIQAWLFATPSIYLATSGSTADLPDAVKWVMLANPMTGLIDFFRSALFGLALPWVSLGVSASMSAGVFFVGCVYFRTVEDSFADVI